MAHEIENFYGVYLLSCKNPRDMTLIVHGFPNQISALKFEWAWQNPFKSRKLRARDGKSKKKSETAYDQKIRIMCMMLQAGPWNRLPLTIRWLKQEYVRNFLPELQPPLHMAIAHGPVRIINKISKQKPAGGDDEAGPDSHVLPSIGVARCAQCSKKMQDKKDMLECYHPGCTMKAHIVCLAQHFLYGTEQLLPLDGTCPNCKHELLWGDLMRHRLGCKDMLEQVEDEEEDGDHWADELL